MPVFPAWRISGSRVRLPIRMTLLKDAIGVRPLLDLGLGLGGRSGGRGSGLLLRLRLGPLGGGSLLSGDLRLTAFVDRENLDAEDFLDQAIPVHELLDLGGIQFETDLHVD